jgi:hypothetical protein
VGNRDLMVPGVTDCIGLTAEELASCVTRLCLDETLRLEFGKRAKDMAIRRFSLVRFLDDWRQAYDKALAS